MGVGLTREPGDYIVAVRIREKSNVSRIESLLRETFSSMRESKRDLIFDIRYTGPAFALQPKPAGPTPPLERPLSIGDSISHAKAFGGTLGFFAKDKSGNPGIVSANHVIAEADEARVGDSIVSPEYGTTGSREVAELVSSVSLHGGGLKLVDAAFARLLPKIDYDVSTLPNGTLQHDIASVQVSTNVQKVGQSSHLTVGTVTSFDYDTLGVLGYSASLPEVDFENQIEIESTNAYDFALDGDSGSLVTTDRFHAVGLLFSRCVAGGTLGNGLAYASPIASVLGLLGVELLP
jgi:hypothetical protein